MERSAENDCHLSCCLLTKDCSKCDTCWVDFCTKPVFEYNLYRDYIFVHQGILKPYGYTFDVWDPTCRLCNRCDHHKVMNGICHSSLSLTEETEWLFLQIYTCFERFLECNGIPLPCLCCNRKCFHSCTLLTEFFGSPIPWLESSFCVVLLLICLAI